MFSYKNKQFVEASEELGNPFEKSGDRLIYVATKLVNDVIASESCKKRKRKKSASKQKNKE